MRQELIKVIAKHIERIGTDSVRKATLQATICEGLLHGLRVKDLQLPSISLR